ncbi:HNH endonuclease [Bacillus paralicheniformis]|uniref:HNH endonuclease n=1 Tax=Bacillus paralicheniformis TaxID=1648923 RepID=UPI00131A25DE|nr:HNH endonuclease [Bacillus paralicheniformis]
METNIVKIKDYRNTSYKNDDFTLGNKKLVFMKKFKTDHPKVRNIYNTLKNRTNKYNSEFRRIYYNKCAYCGISTQVIDSSRFEVDHVIPLSTLKINLDYSRDKINGIENLVNSCQMCNRGKRDFYCDEENLKILHPDYNCLPQIFYRKKDYSIDINEDYGKNSVIIEFYRKLKFDNQLRRLDYLLMEMKDFCDIHEGEAIINDIQKLIFKIESKRRANY